MICGGFCVLVDENKLIWVIKAINKRQGCSKESRESASKA